jgi:hypothetical protein
MKVQWLVASAFIWGAALGCQQNRSVLADNGSTQQPAALLRSQKPEVAPDRKVGPAHFLDHAPDGPGERPDSTAVVIWATVNNAPIFENEIQSAASPALLQLSPSEPDYQQRRREIMEQVLEMLIDRELVLQDAYSRLKGPGGTKFLDKLKEAAGKRFDDTVMKGLKERTGQKTAAEVKEFLKQRGISLDGMRTQFERQFIYQEYLQWRVGSLLDRIGPEQILDYYRNHPEEFQTVDSVDWQDIFIAASRHPTREAARQFAEHLVGRARSGEDFVRLCMQYDNGNAHEAAGAEGQGHRHGEIRPVEAEPPLFAGRDGDVGLVELASGFHVIRLARREYAGLLPFNEKTQTRIREKLRGDLFAREAKKLVADLKRTATIDIASNPP